MLLTYYIYHIFPTFFYGSVNLSISLSNPLISEYFSFFFFFLMIRRPPRSTLSSSSAASDVYKRQPLHNSHDRDRKLHEPCTLPTGSNVESPVPQQITPVFWICLAFKLRTGMAGEER
eukprot:TRINITY_DN282_c0_g1_i7.p1 TRINITY_DN282_c0_g1~~TRINITY_DN282_c0_g1_i7.p1  ORF type:complete len:118 (+),score=13.62 TRINITY_DN282_c0_g1_i7:21-374(+)